MGTKTFNNYESLLTFTRASKGHALRPVSYGSEEVTNGTFDTDTTGWTASGTQSVVNGKLYWVRSSLGGVYQSITTKAGSIYVVDFTLSDSVGSVRFTPRDGSVGGTQIGNVDLNDGTRRLIFVALSSTTVLYWQNTSGSGGEFYLDDVSAKEVTFDQPDGTLTLFEHPDNIPRVEWDAQRNRLGLLVEEARSNLVPSSGVEDWTNVSGATTEPITETTLGAFTGKTVISQNQGWHRIQSPAFSVTSGTTYTITAFYKAGTSGRAYIDFRIPTNSTVINGTAGALTVSSNSAGTGTILSQETLSDDVYKVVFTVAANATASNAFIGIGPNSTTVGETVIALAAQVEQASFGTSYIKTTGATATRSADVQDIQLANFGYNHDKGTVLVEFSQDFDYGSTGFPRAFEIGDPSTERVNLFVNESNGGLVAGANFNNVNQVGMVLETETDGRVDTTKVAYAFADDDFAASDDGETVVTDTSGTFSGGTPRTKLLIGPSNFCGHIKSIKYYPRRLTNAQLQDLTS